jgi:hypothetical protein
VADAAPCWSLCSINRSKALCFSSSRKDILSGCLVDIVQQTSDSSSRTATDDGLVFASERRIKICSLLGHVTLFASARGTDASGIKHLVCGRTNFDTSAGSSLASPCQCRRVNVASTSW